MGTELIAGAAAVPLPAPPGAPMMGYALRSGHATGALDPLAARGFYARCGGCALLIECDLCLLSPAQARAVREEVARRTGLVPASILVGCIHTHSGPDTGLGELLAGRAPPPFVAALLDAAVEAGVQAVRAAAPARLAVGRTRAEIGRNRAEPDGPLDPEVPVVRVDTREGRPLAVLYAHGCHPTALGHDNLLYSADWPGAAAEVLAEAFPGCVPLFLLGAHGDIDPRTRGVMDLAVSGQSAGTTPSAMRALGRELGAAVAEEAASLAPDSSPPVGAARGEVSLAVHGGADAEAAAERLAGLRRSALRALDLPEDAELRTAELFAAAEERTAGLTREEVRERRARVRLYLRDRLAPRFAGGRVARVEVQAVRLGPLALLGLPLEATTAVGLEWRSRTGGEASVVGIAGGWMRYLPHRRDFEHPRAHLHYEVLHSTFEPAAAERLLDRGEELLAGLPA